MKKYVYDNHEIDEGMYTLLQLLDLYEGKYTGSLPYEVGFTLEFLIKLLNFYVVPKDRYKEVDFVDTKLICQYVYKKKDIKKYKRNKKLNKFEKNNINYKKTIY